jgi:DHA2 family multidrug resistance protein
MLFLNQAAISSVSPSEAGDASGLFNAARNLGGSIGLALLATLQERRVDFHQWSIHSALQANDSGVQDWAAAQAASFGGGVDGLAAAYRSINSLVLQQATVMAFNDDFVALALGIVLVSPLVFLLRPIPKGPVSMAIH